MWEMFLEKNNQRKIELIKTLERATELIVDKKKLLIDLEISEFVLNSTLEDIEIDLERFRLAKEFKIVVVNGSCSIESNGKVNSETLARQFAAESLFIKILISIFNEDSLSLNNFSEKNLVNYPSAHKTMKQLKVFFKKNSVNINKTMVFKPENEGHFRLLLVYIFNNLFRNNYSIYKDSQIREVDIYLKKNKHLLSEVKNSRINELKHFLIISIMRTSKGHSIKNAVHLVEINQIELVSQTKFKKSYSELLKIKLKSKAIRKNEKLHFKAYLISRGILKGRECSLPTVIQKLNSNFIKEISNRIPEGKELLSKSQEIKDHLTRIHFQTLLFPTIHNEDYKGLDFKFICDVHPKVFYIVQ